MKKIMQFFLIVLLLLIFGCLTFETAEFRIIFNQNSMTEGTIEIIYSNIETSEALLKDQQKDFNELIESYTGDDFLLDQMSDGVYVKERELYEENGKLIGNYKGIFRNFEFDNEPLKIVNDEFILLIDADDDEIVETNGNIIKSEKNTFISWPKEQKELYWKFKMARDPKATSLLEMFWEWKEKQE